MADSHNIIERLGELLLDPSQRHVEPREGQIGHCRMFSQAKSIDEANRTIDFVCSDKTLDRYGEIVEPSAFRGSLDAFMKNPVFPYSHTYEAIGGQPPTLGHWRSVRVTDSALLGTAWFKDRGLGAEVFRDYIEGNLSAVSVGFITRAYEMRQVKIDGREQLVRVFTDVDLLEISAVVIPANPSARIRAATYAAGAGGGTGFLERLESLMLRLESKLSTGPDGHQRDPDDGDGAPASRGCEQGFVDGYFGDIPGADPEPAPRSHDQGDDEDTTELKHALRDVMTARGGT